MKSFVTLTLIKFKLYGKKQVAYSFISLFKSSSTFLSIQTCLTFCIVLLFVYISISTARKTVFPQ